MELTDFIPLICAAVAFVGWHFVVSSTRLCDLLVGRIGANAYRGLFSLVAIATLVWLIVAYRQAPDLSLWDRSLTLIWLAVAVMPLAFILLIASLRPDNPTSALQPRQFDRAGIFAITRHPMMWGIGLWALLHILANGDVASLILFGSLGGLALGGTLAIDAKTRRRDPERWGRLAAVTSNLPFAALAARRTHLSPRALLWPVVIGLVVYGVVGGLHNHVFGVWLPIF